MLRVRNCSYDVGRELQLDICQEANRQHLFVRWARLLNDSRKFGSVIGQRNSVGAPFTWELFFSLNNTAHVTSS
jgi:hypothetical protein